MSTALVLVCMCLLQLAAHVDAQANGVNIVFAGKFLTPVEKSKHPIHINVVGRRLRDKLQNAVERINEKHHHHRARKRIADAIHEFRPICHRITDHQRRERCLRVVDKKARRWKKRADEEKGLVNRRIRRRDEASHVARVKRIADSRPILGNMTSALTAIFGKDLDAHTKPALDQVWEAIKNVTEIRDYFVDECLATVVGGHRKQCKGNVLTFGDTLLHALYKRVHHHDLKRPKNLYKPWKNEFHADEKEARSRFYTEHSDRISWPDWFRLHKYENYLNDDDDDDDDDDDNHHYHRHDDDERDRRFDDDDDDDDEEDDDDDLDWRSDFYHDFANGKERKWRAELLDAYNYHRDLRSYADDDDDDDTSSSWDFDDTQDHELFLYQDSSSLDKEWDRIRHREHHKVFRHYDDSSWRSGRGSDWRKLLDASGLVIEPFSLSADVRFRNRKHSARHRSHLHGSSALRSIVYLNRSEELSGSNDVD